MMFNFGKKSDKSVATDEKEPVGKSFTERLKAGLDKTRQALFGDIRNLIGKGSSLDEVMEQLETHLISADAGIEATMEIMQELNKTCRDEAQLFPQLQQILTNRLLPHEKALDIDSLPKPAVILVVGVNGAGKTTTIGKLARRYQQSGHKVMLAAGDTFRAAAVEQLQTWGERNDVPVIAQASGADSASVIYDAVEAARARGVDILIADTAGRLHNKTNLMDELAKIKRVMGKLDSTAPHEVLLVLDAGTGQNAVSQTSQFHQAMGITGLALTKLDGTAKGGVLFALARQFDLPVRFIGVGEQIDDLRDFRASEFVTALLGIEQSDH
jgi:fused signal recognition particle receptor